ncbi:hypothetical protein [Streptomyces sp. NPDC051173]|uniref:hypothetical protein n=1 Tax=Streptomyces sp. NPDC051173 TaxID=3155164 RepID=UPI00344E0AF1
MNKEIPPCGAYVIDSRTGTVSQVIGHTRDFTFVRLRQPGGGREWSCPAASAQTTTLRAYLRVQVSEINNRRRIV